MKYLVIHVIMEEEIDQHHIDGTSPVTETAVDVLLSAVCLDSASLPASLSSPTSDQKSQSSSREEIDCRPESSALMTSTPVPPRPRNLPSRLLANPEASTSPRGSGCSADSLGVGTCVSVIAEESTEEEARLRAPIVGYEIMEQRAKFTVFKIHVRKSDRENWLIFRRYTDFVRVNNKLRDIFPIFRLALPPKRWFGSNFDPNFLEDRQLGLQAFIDNIIGHKDIVLSGPVREFLCLDDLPSPHDNLEESRALCESLDESVYNLRMDIAERDKKIAVLNTELDAAQERISQLLHSQLLTSCGGTIKAKNSSTPVSGENSTIEGDLHSQVEADQSMSFTQAQIHNSSAGELHNEDSLSMTLDDVGSQSLLTSSKERGLKEGLVKDEEDERHSTQPDIITVT